MPTSSFPTRRDPAQGRDRAVGALDLALLHADARSARASSTNSPSTPSGRTCPRRRRTRSSTARARTRSASSMTTACAPTRPRSRSRASSPISSGASARPKANGRARSCTKYFTDIPCSACNGFRLKPEALAVKVAGLHIGEAAEMCVKRAGEWFAALPSELTAKQNEIAGARAQGNPRAAEIPGRCRARISHARARLRHAVGRREPAHPARLPDRLGPDRRALRARRAFDRPAPARQCAAPGNAQAAARPRQHRDRGRA